MISFGLRRLVRQRFWRFTRTKFGISNGAMTGRTLQVRAETNLRSYGVEVSVLCPSGEHGDETNNHVFIEVIP
jgi:hypothetical protein